MKRLLLVLALMLCAPYAMAQQGVKIQVPTGNGNSYQTIGPTFPLSVLAGSFSTVVSSSITRPANTTTYTANTGWCNTTSACATVFTWTGACSTAGKMVLIPQISIYSSASPTLKLSGYLWIFKATPGTVISDNANFNIASTDYANLTAGSKGGIPFTLTSNQGSGAANSGVSITGLNVMAQCASGAATLTGMVEVGNAYVPASGEVLTIDISTIGVN